MADRGTVVTSPSSPHLNPPSLLGAWTSVAPQTTNWTWVPAMVRVPEPPPTLGQIWPRNK